MPDSKKSPLNLSLDLALTGKGAPAKADYEAALKGADAALVWLRQQAADKSLELLGIPGRTDDLKAAQKVAAAITGAKTIAVLGIGGSSLGGQALTSLRKKQGVEFHDNPDPFSWAATLKRVDLKKTHFIAISKSGGTAETLMQVLTAADALEKLGVKALKKGNNQVTATISPTPMRMMPVAAAGFSSEITTSSSRFRSGCARSTSSRPRMVSSMRLP